MPRWWQVALVLAVACTPAGDTERAADQAYAAGRYRIALDGYRRLIRGDAPGRLVAKAAAAAEHAGERPEALAALVRLAGDDPSRVPDAVDALVRLATTSLEAGDSAGLRNAVLAVRRLSPERLPPRLALATLRAGLPNAADANLLVPYALAASPEPAAVDSLLYLYAHSFDPATQCEPAVGAYRAVIRRGNAPDLKAAAVADLSGCGMRLGDAALMAGQGDAAERWYRLGVGADSAVTSSRAALVGVARARAVLGDLDGARRILASMGTFDDSLGQAARSALAGFDTLQAAGDTARAGRP